MTDKLPLIYIVGTGRSGSTLLDLMLNAHPQISSVGEIHFLDRWIFHDALCSCNAPISKCSFWARVLEGPPTKQSLPILGTNQADSTSTEYASANEKIFKNVCNVAKVKMAVDSSKSLKRLKMLSQSGLFDLHVIHLVRDGRAYLSSRLRHGRHPRVMPGSLPRRTSLMIIIRWVLVNLGIRRYLANWEKGPKIILRYEDLVSMPELELRRVCAAFGMSYHPEMVSPSAKNIHNISGSGWRFLAGDKIRLKSDRSWPLHLKLRHRLVFAVTGGWLNRFFGYTMWRSNPDRLLPNEYPGAGSHD